MKFVINSFFKKDSIKLPNINFSLQKQKITLKYDTVLPLYNYEGERKAFSYLLKSILFTKVCFHIISKYCT